MNRRPRTAAVGAHLSASDVARLVLRGEDVAPGLREQVLRAAERVQRAVLRRNRHDAGADPEHDDARPGDALGGKQRASSRGSTPPIFPIGVGRVESGSVYAVLSVRYKFNQSAQLADKTVPPRVVGPC